MNKLLAVALALIYALPLGAEEQVTFESLRSSDQFKSRVWITPDSNISVGQQIELNIELTTSRWFTAGTRIGRLEMDDAIVLKRHKFAVNSTYREQGSTWSVQTWTITIYPQREGKFLIPSVKLRVSVAGPDGQTLEGEVASDELSFVAELPQQLSEQLDNQSETTWVSSPHFEVTEQYSRSFDNIKVGDAVRRTISMQADSVAAMMLPIAVVESGPGLAAYQKPAQIEDRVNRGTYRALRRESITYVAEVAGDYVLPEIDFWWWNTNTHLLQKITLPAQSIRVNKASATGIADGIRAWSAERWPFVVLLLILLAVTVIAYRKGLVHSVLSRLQELNIIRERQEYQKILEAYESGDNAKAVRLMQRWFVANDLPGNTTAASRIEHWLESTNEQKLLADYQHLIEAVFSAKNQSVSNGDFRALVLSLKLQRRKKAQLLRKQHHRLRTSTASLNPR